MKRTERRKRVIHMFVNGVVTPFTFTLCLFFINLLTGGKYGWLININALSLGVSILWVAALITCAVVAKRNIEKAFAKRKFDMENPFEAGDYINGKLELVKGGEVYDYEDEGRHRCTRVQRHEVQQDDGWCGSGLNA